MVADEVLLEGIEESFRCGFGIRTAGRAAAVIDQDVNIVLFYITGYYLLYCFIVTIVRHEVIVLLLSIGI